MVAKLLGHSRKGPHMTQTGQEIFHVIVFTCSGTQAKRISPKKHYISFPNKMSNQLCNKLIFSSLFLYYAVGYAVSWLFYTSPLHTCIEA